MQTERLKIADMSCGGCTTKVTRALEAVSGVRDVTVSLSAGTAEVHYNELLTSPEELAEAVQRVGYVVGNPSTNQKQQGTGGCCC